MTTAGVRGVLALVTLVGFVLLAHGYVEALAIVISFAAIATVRWWLNTGRKRDKRR